MKWWRDRNPRERLLIAGAGAAALLAGAWEFGYKPVVAYREDARQAFVRSKALLDDVTVRAGELKAMQALSSGKAPRADQSMRVTITTTAHDMGVTISRLEPESSGGLTVWFEEVGAEPLHGWIARLQEDHGITVGKASIRRHDSKTAVRAQILLVQGSGGQGGNG